MRWTLAHALAFAVALVVGGDILLACGDKLLPLGRAIRFQSGYTSKPATILVYAPVGSPSSTAFSETKLESALSEAGHRLRVVGNAQGLEAAIKAAQPDIVLVDFVEIDAVEDTVRGASPRPFLLPVAYRGTKDEIKAIERKYGLVLKAPGRAGHYCSLVDKAMERRSEAE